MSKIEPIYKEQEVPVYELPDVLKMVDGTKIEAADDWPKRRQELTALFESHIYGRMIPPLPDTRFETVEEGPAFNGLAIRKQVRVFFAEDDDQSMEILLYLPNAGAPVPVFLGLNFSGNHTIHSDPEIRLSTRWMPERGEGVVEHRATEASRGSRQDSWQVEMLLSRGYGLATVYYGDLDPDFDDGFCNGIHPLFYQEGQEQPLDDESGSIGAWAWGLSRCMDYFESVREIDSSRVALMGHSRLGKTALWAGACDERFALVISNQSGCGGAAISRRCYGETVHIINALFPHWFCRNFQQYNNRENELPIDQHMLVTLIAPRPVYIASAVEDKWSDPRGEFLAACHADPVYRLLTGEGLPAHELPRVDEPEWDRIGYHIRSGGHSVNEYDWYQFIAFADFHLK